MDKQLIPLFKKQLLEQRASLQIQIASLRGGTISRAQASADHFGQPEDSRAQMVTERDLNLRWTRVKPPNSPPLTRP